MVGHRSGIEKLYTDTCTIYGKVKQGSGSFTKYVDGVVIEDEPCRVSYETISESTQTTTTNNTSIVVKLFIPPDIEVKEGSKIKVTRNGRDFMYRSSGKPAYFTTHQEIVLSEDGKA
jgi:hypothetical protein